MEVNSFLPSFFVFFSGNGGIYGLDHLHPSTRAEKRKWRRKVVILLLLSRFLILLKMLAKRKMMMMRWEGRQSVNGRRRVSQISLSPHFLPSDPSTIGFLIQALSSLLLATKPMSQIQTIAQSMVVSVAFFPLAWKSECDSTSLHLSSFILWVARDVFTSP